MAGQSDATADVNGEIGAIRKQMIRSMKGRVGCGLTTAGTRRVREELADAIIADLGLREANPFGTGGHGLHCWSRTGGKCDCTAADATYFTVDLSGG